MAPATSRISASMPRRELGVRSQESGVRRQETGDGSDGGCGRGVFTAGDAEGRRTMGTGKMAEVFVVGHLGQVEKWAVLLGFWGKMAKMAYVAKHF